MLSGILLLIYCSIEYNKFLTTSYMVVECMSILVLKQLYKVIKSHAWYLVGNTLMVLPTCLLFSQPRCLVQQLCLPTAGEGCNFITADCDTWAYSCSPPNADGCSYDYQAEVYL